MIMADQCSRRVECKANYMQVFYDTLSGCGCWRNLEALSGHRPHGVVIVSFTTIHPTHLFPWTGLLSRRTTASSPQSAVHLESLYVTASSGHHVLNLYGTAQGSMHACRSRTYPLWIHAPARQGVNICSRPCRVLTCVLHLGKTIFMHPSFPFKRHGSHLPIALPSSASSLSLQYRSSKSPYLSIYLTSFSLLVPTAIPLNM